jgi:putative ABC transport system permease protein
MATAILGVVILVIAWINFVNLTLARSLERAKEVAVRKVSGASRLDLIAQHAVEYGLVNLLGAGLAAVLVLVFHPAVFRLMERDVALGAVLLDPGFLWAAVTILLLGVLLSGFYPAFVQSSYGTMILFKPKHKASAHRLDPRKLLVVLQFTASIVLIIGVITIFLQIRFMRTQALGVDIERTLVTYSSMNDIGSAKRQTSLQTFKDKVRALPGVEAVATASVVPGKEIIWQRQDIRKAEDLPNTKKNYDYAYVDHDFIPAFKLALRAGRNFSDNTAAESASVILNETAVKQVGFADARAAVDAFIWIGAKPFKIVGVIGDYHQESLRKEIRPIVYYCGYKWLYDVGYYAVKIRSKDIRSTVESIRGIWKEIYPLDNFEYRFLDEAFDQQYKEDRRFGALFALFTLLAVFVACLGLQGLATYAIEKRTKEIGIRKVNGATVSQIVVMLVRDFAAWVVVAFVIASPIAYTVMNTWLQNYAYRIDLSWTVFAVAGVLAMAIAIGTTFLQAYRAATGNPVEALRYE